MSKILTDMNPKVNKYWTKNIISLFKTRAQKVPFNSSYLNLFPRTNQQKINSSEKGDTIPRQNRFCLTFFLKPA